jgi:hypothetical protein
MDDLLDVLRAFLGSLLGRLVAGRLARTANSRRRRKRR